MTDAPAPLSAARRWLAIAAIFLIAVGTSFHAYRASATKSATFDEPVHMASSWLIVNEGDFRLNPEHPPLWKYLAGLPLIGQPLAIPLDVDPAKKSMQILESQWWWISQVFSTTKDGVSPITLLQQSRGAMAVVPFLLTLAIARWAWALAGPVAAIFASLFLAFDPNLLGHGALVTNDVPATLIFTLAGYFTWRLGTRWRWTDAGALALVCALGAGIKFTTVLLVPMVGVPLLIRALHRVPWQIGASLIASRGRRLATVASLAIVTGLLTYALIWPMYQFRTAATRDGTQFDQSYARRLYAYYTLAYQATIDHPETPVDTNAIRRAVQTYEPDLSMSAFYSLADHRVLPEAMSFGITYAKGRSITRPGFFLGEYSDHGFVGYFPLSILVKTPAMTLLAAAGSLVIAIALLWTRRREPHVHWALLCLALPPAIYLASAMLSNLNIGIRHILPVYPFVYVAIGTTLALSMRRSVRGWKPARFLAGTSIALLAIETCSAYPNYISFFNRPSGGERAGLKLLGDSNLDWGQDLPALAEWAHYYQRGNPGRPLYLAYFGSVDPQMYRVTAVNAEPGFPFASVAPVRVEDMAGGVLAISASYLQGTLHPHLRPWYDYLREQEPIAILNGTIYVYRLPERR